MQCVVCIGCGGSCVESAVAVWRVSGTELEHFDALAHPKATK